MELDKPYSTAQRLRQIMQERGLKQADILRLCKPHCEEMGVKMGSNDLSQYVTGKIEPGQYKLIVLAKALNVSEAWLMGLDVPRERTTTAAEKPVAPLSIPGLYPIRRKSFPLLGDIACGEPAYAEEEHETMIESTDTIDADFCLRAHGDSMTGAQIDDGDVVFIKQMSMVDNGDIAAVVIENETTLKRVDYDPGKAQLILWPENPAYRPLIYQGEQLNQIRILGRAVMIQKIIRRK